MATTGLTSKKLLTPEQMMGKARLFGDVTIEVNGNLDFHEHHGEIEAYYILEGTGLYDDNHEKQYTVSAGDVTYCESGKGHGIINTGDTTLRFIALIINE